MRTGGSGWGRRTRYAVPLGLWLAACGDSGTTSDGASTTEGGVSVDPTTAGPAPTTGGTTVDLDTTAGSATQGVTETTAVPTTGGPTGDPTDTSATTMVTTDGETASTGTTSPIDSSTGETASTGSTSSTSTTGETGETSGSSSEGTTEPAICEPGDGGGMMGPVEKSFIWIASQNLSDISKVDTQTMVELARYRTGPSGNESPSRTAVSADGRFVVVNNRQTGRSTMIAANVEDCVDNNGNGVIDTSLNKDDLRAWGQDECVRWSQTWPFKGAWEHGPRGVTWTLGTWDYDLCQYVEPKVWIGYLSNEPGTVTHLVRVDGLSGIVEETIKVPNWNGSGFAPYGAALDPQFRPWFSSLRGEFVRVNTDQNPITVTRFTPPAALKSYGFTVDADGNPWFAGWDDAGQVAGVTVYDVAADAFVQVPGSGGAGTIRRGIAADDKYVWAAANAPQCGLLQIDRVTRQMIQFHTPNPCSTAIGLSVDAEGFVWLVDQGGWAWKFDPDNVAGMSKVDIVGQHYVYSDMTGGQLLSITPQ